MPAATALTPRKTPRQARARVTCDAIVEAAARIVAQRGLAGFNTNAVAERAGVSIGSLYQYFPNKDALMIAVIARQQERQAVTLELAGQALAVTPLGDVVRLLVRAAMNHHRDDALFASAIDHEEARLSVHLLAETALERGGLVIKTLLEQRVDELPGIDPQRAARSLPALVRAVVDSWANLPEPDLAAAEEEAIRAVLGYLRYD